MTTILLTGEFPDGRFPEIQKKSNLPKSKTVGTELVVLKHEPTDHPRKGQMEQTEKCAYVLSL